MNSALIPWMGIVDVIGFQTRGETVPLQYLAKEKGAKHLPLVLYIWFNVVLH